MKFTGLILTVLVLFISSASGLFPDILTNKERLHKIQLSNPGDSSAIPQIHDLIEVLDSVGLPKEYYMTVRSVYCLDHVCKVEPVKIYWNNLGEYLRFELSEGVKLEKNKGVEFDAADYRKLQTILSNPNSPLKDLQIKEITGYEKKAANSKVDAYSGATVIDLDDDVTVKGATLTCYTLWHWCNGNIKEKIQSLTKKAYTPTQLLKFVKGTNNSAQVFALKQLTEREAYSTTVVEGITTSAQHMNRESHHELMKYFDEAPSEVYYPAIATLFKNAKSFQRINYLRSLNTFPNSASDTYYNNMSVYLKDLNEFQEVDLILHLFATKKQFSPMIINNTINLLNKNILIARRAYYFLINLSLNKQQKQLLNKFNKKNHDYL